ncbi:hypothetical protein BJV85_003672 [Clostridium acetobutylicum]|uniref:Uncharacterized protein n=1 Tax=Clostridium acetobutylicum (strain ATCC 824 / DSM 792 / JCM 1419 / IAM 19013 / LMG 5710 / NBRC 13948 / NRRL B-527 / VKM B-1787 / 2291 / W) TaxID=272562 RepID=Q97M53_CLOAB|nr:MULTISPECIES: hypothetical protein [Clostridium]AAK78327.1 Hypothetical protein CA_C0347 [Clostridium acetobutylicum ATCC 824]ADZ19396.1 hypothetical protein CEA_G0357 [Clostridium acetobutylicum EA 2018]AEI31186.1 hypothetical protein SMB_G0355 [Clostridium acetobutylicum DSM 1731]AWV80052.1 hypothetical protein DK921_08090 [Clostridium acetobutylicum]MBC2395873.1 hypothetical protein [Clostridium acetobutylicum]
MNLTLEDTLLDWLTWKSGIGVFAVFSVLSYQLKMELNNKSPFKINKDKIKKRKEYEGESLKEGLWEVMQIENKINIKNYEIEIL